MPERTKKDHKHGRHSGHTGSRWHNFHFSGKLISCSVIFGFLLILVGGILLAIGMDKDEESKSDDYGDLQKKPPLIYVGPAIMGIGGFTVIVGVIMCLVETKVFRRRGGDANPLINSEGGESGSSHNGNVNGETDPTSIPSDSKHYKKHHRGKKSHKKAGNGKKSHSPNSHSSIEASPSSSQSSEPIGISAKGSRNFLNASDTFLTPPGSFTQDDLQMHAGKRDAVNQTTASLMKSFNSSGTYSTEFQTPSASFIDTPSFPSSQDSTEVPIPQPLLNLPANLNAKSLENARHEFLTPQNSNADILESPKKPKEVVPIEENSSLINRHAFLTPQNSNADILESPKNPKTVIPKEENEEDSPLVNRHAFLTPKNSADLLEDSPPIEETLEHRMENSLNHLYAPVSKKSLDKVNTMSVVADVHEPSQQHASDINNASVKPLTNLSKSQEEVEHSDIKVDVLIDAIDEEVKGNIHSSTPSTTDEETGKSSEAHSARDDEASNLTELKDSADGVNAHSLELTSGDNFNKDSLNSNEDLDSRIDDHVDSLNHENADE